MSEHAHTNGAAGTDGAETVVGQDPRREALDLLDGAWNTRLAETERAVPGAGDERLAETQLAAAQITALIYVGDQIAAIRHELADGTLYVNARTA